VPNPDVKVAKLETAVKNLSASVQDVLDMFSRVHDRKLSTDQALQGLFNRAQERVTQVEEALSDR
jgi:hypothetical protein